MAMIRVLEITNCFECPHLDNRWSEPPWNCEEGCLKIYKKHMETVHKDCPLDTKEEYLAATEWYRNKRPDR